MLRVGVLDIARRCHSAFGLSKISNPEFDRASGSQREELLRPFRRKEGHGPADLPALITMMRVGSRREHAAHPAGCTAADHPERQIVCVLKRLNTACQLLDTTGTLATNPDPKPKADRQNSTRSGRWVMITEQPVSGRSWLPQRIGTRQSAVRTDQDSSSHNLMSGIPSLSRQLRLMR
jgi:hypothetical protein